MTQEQATILIDLLTNIELFIFIIMSLKFVKIITKCVKGVIKKIKEN